MKKKIILILLGFITLWSCQQDDFLREQNISTQEMSDFELKKISFSSLKTNQNVLQKIEKLNSLKKISSGSNHRTIYNDQYGVFIDTTHIMMISEGNKHTITFKIVSEENDKEFENLILNSKQDGGYFAYIAKYELTEEESIRIKNGENVNIFPISILDIEDVGNQENNNNQTSSIGVSGPCISTESYWSHICTNSAGESTVIGYSGQGQNSPSGGECANGTLSYVQVQVISINIDCVSGGGGTGGGTGGGSGGGSGGSTGGGTGGGFGSGGSGGSGSGGGNQNPILTTPILFKPKDIEKLNKITKQNSDLPFRAKIDEYVGLIDTAQEEIGVMYNKSISGEYIPIAPLETGIDYVKFPPAVITTEVIIHLHHNFVKPTGEALAPVPSGGDVTGFAKTFREMGNASARNNLTSIVVTRNGLYAFRVNSPTTLSAAADSFNNPNEAKKFEEFFEKEVIEKAKEEAKEYCQNSPCTQESYDMFLDLAYEKYFIKFINRTGLGVSIYKGVLNPYLEGYYEWTKITN